MLRILVLLALSFAPPVHAADTTASLTMQNRAWNPGELNVPAGQRIELHVKNMDAQAIEFESEAMHREKVIPAGQEVVVNIGPLRAGSYEFINDFNPTARGHVVAK